MENDGSAFKTKLTDEINHMAFASMDEPVTIDEVIYQLQRLISESIEAGDRIGFFASLYHRVTIRIREGIQNNEFENNQRMEKLDVIFANKYLMAVKQWQKKEHVSDPWRISFEAARRSSVLVLQHLLLGMNAHINLDLGIAAVQTASGGDIKDISKDFNSINSILGSLLYEVINEINRVSPLISLFGLHSANDSILIQFSMTNARDGAWRFAEDLSTKTGNEFDACIAGRSESIKKLGSSLIDQNGLIRLTILIIRLFEWRNAKRIILALNAYKKKFIHVP